MNRSILALNLALTVTLCLLLARNARPGREADPARPAQPPLPGLRVTVAGPSVLLDFGLPMVSAGEVAGEAPPDLVSLEPQAPFLAHWVTPSLLRLEPLQPLRPATLYRVLVNARARTQDGRPLPSASASFETQRLALRDPQIEEDDQGRLLGISLRFSLEVAPEALAAVLRVRGDDGGTVPARLEWPDPLVCRVAFPDERERVFLEIDGSLLPRVGDLPLGKPGESIRREVVLKQALRLQAVEPGTGELMLTFGHSIPEVDPAFVTIEPPLPVTIARHQGGCRIRGAFAAGSAYAITLRAGFPGRGRARLDKDLRESVLFPDLPEELEFADRGIVLSSRARPEVEIAGVNVDTARIELRRIHPNNVVWSIVDPWQHPTAPPVVANLTTQAPRNQAFRKRIDLSEIGGGPVRGIWRIRLDSEGTYPKTRLLQVTDLAVTARASEGAVAVRVASLATGAPVASASVLVVSAANQELARGATDADGAALLTFEPGAKDREPFLVQVVKEEDACFVDFKQFRVDGPEGEGAARAYLGEGYEACILFDRGIVRPGETLHATVSVRNALGAAPATATLEARWFDPSRRLAASERLREPGAGLMVAHLSTAPEAPSGLWRLDIMDAQREERIGSAPFQVRAFVPDALETLLSLKGPFRFGGEALAEVEGRWLEGSPAAERPAMLHVRFDRVDFSPPGLEGYSFRAMEDSAPPGAIPSISALLDGGGRAAVKFTLPGCDTPFQALRLRATAEVTDPAGRPARTSGEALVTRSGFLLGVNAGEQSASIVAVTPEGTPLGAPLDATVCLEERWFEWECGENGRGRTEWRQEARAEVVARESIRIEGGRATWTHGGTRPARGCLVVTARAGGALAEQAIGGAPPRPDRLRVLPSAEPLAEGGLLRARVEAPFDGSAFLTLEGPGLLATRVLAMRRGSNEVEMRLPASLPVPNVHLVVSLNRAQDQRGVEGPFWMVGSASVPILHEERRVDVGLIVPERVEPEQEIEVALRAPGALLATVAVVDEGILRLTQHPDPDPLRFFLAPRRPSTRGADTGTALLSAPRFPESPGGDGAMSRRLQEGTSRSTETVALFAGPVALKPDGSGSARFRLPSCEGRLRVMVIAAGPRAVGAASADVTVSGPVGLAVATPRLLAPGDEAEVAVTLRNSTGADGEVRLELEGLGGLVPLSSLAPVPLKAGELRTATLRVRAGDVAGLQALRCAASIGERRREISARIHVRPMAAFATVRSGIAAAGPLAIEGDFLPGTVRARVTLAGSPEARLLPALLELTQYPHGCAEQTTSRCFAILGCRGLLPLLAPEGAAPDPARLIEAGIARLRTMQTGRGGISLWPGGVEDDFITVYVLDLLLDARAQGILVSDDFVAEVVREVQARLASGGKDYPRFAAVEALGRAGRPIGGWLSRLGAVAGDAESRALLALALARNAQHEAAREMLAGLEGAEVPRDQGGSFSSPLRALALELRARLFVTPGDPRIVTVAETLATRAARPGEMNTHEAGQVLRALAAYHASHAAALVAAAAGLRVGDREIPLPGGRSGWFDVTGPLSLSSATAVFGALEYEGFRRDAPAQEIPGLLLRREVIDLGNGKPTITFRRGGIYEVCLVGRAKRPLENPLLTDILPGGFEVDPPEESPKVRREVRDDRVLFFPDSLPEGDFRFTYRARAVFAGRFAGGRTTCECLYEPGTMLALPAGEAVEIR